MLMTGRSLEKVPNEISLYFHVPFCTHKCAYCHFYVIPDKDSFKIQYMDSLRLEWEKWRSLLQDKQITTVYFGGGTPALLGPKAIGDILDWVRSCSLSSDAEITLEANPENITRDLMSAYASVGINRISIGVQTLDSHLLTVLDRKHSAEKSIQAVHATAEAGISNISIDLMYDLPGQTLASWQRTLKAAAQLPITHLSLYNLTIEPHTVFFKHEKNLRKQMPDPETSLQMYQQAVDILQENGLFQYEISAFAKPNYQSRHNVGYWTARPFLGLGPSAFSYWQGRRFRNVANLSKYSKALNEGLSPIDFDEQLDAEAQRRELLVIELRLVEGVCFKSFEKKHGTLDNETIDTLKRLKEEGLMDFTPERVRLTKRGILFYDTIASRLI